MDGLRWPWALAAVAAAVLVLLVWWSRPTHSSAAGALPVAHAEALRALPRYQRLARRQRIRGILLTLGALAVVTGAGLAVARPQTTDTEPRDSRSRDLLLCLDASASMDDDNATVVRELRKVTGRLEGDRVGMMIWSSAAVMVFPLTDDYDYVRQQLDRAEAAFEKNPEGFFAGVDVDGAGASLIGDGIVSCSERFDRPAADRTRVLIVASDNEPLGRRAYSLSEAAAVAKSEKVLLYGIGASSLDQPERAAAREEFQQAAISTGGFFTVAGEDDAAEQISRRIQDLARARSAELPRVTNQDAPLLAGLTAGGGLVLLSLVWVAGLFRRRSR